MITTSSLAGGAYSFLRLIGLSPRYVADLFKRGSLFGLMVLHHFLKKINRVEGYLAPKSLQYLLLLQRTPKR
jgi:hypothetical protein